jgi:hypothetical protein
MVRDAVSVSVCVSSRHVFLSALTESLMGALSRTLMDEYKKSSDFALTVMQIFQW